MYTLLNKASLGRCPKIKKTRLMIPENFTAVGVVMKGNISH